MQTTDVAAIGSEAEHGGGVSIRSCAEIGSTGFKHVYPFYLPFGRIMLDTGEIQDWLPQTQARGIITMARTLKKEDPALQRVMITYSANSDQTEVLCDKDACLLNSLSTLEIEGKNQAEVMHALIHYLQTRDSDLVEFIRIAPITTMPGITLRKAYGERLLNEKPELKSALIMIREQLQLAESTPLLGSLRPESYHNFLSSYFQEDHTAMITADLKVMREELGRNSALLLWVNQQGLPESQDDAIQFALGGGIALKQGWMTEAACCKIQEGLRSFLPSQGTPWKCAEYSLATTPSVTSRPVKRNADAAGLNDRSDNFDEVTAVAVPLYECESKDSSTKAGTSEQSVSFDLLSSVHKED